MAILGRKPPTPEPAPEKKDPARRKLDGLEEVLAWRALGLLDLGFTIEQVLVLVNRPDVVHEAEALVARGCPLYFVFDELAP